MKKNSLLILLLLPMVLTLTLFAYFYLPARTIEANAESTLISTEGVPISTIGELQGLSSNGKYYLTCDINLSGVIWRPKNFAGTFNGNGFTINNLKVVSNDEYAGLFGKNTGTIKNLRVENCTVEQTYTNHSAAGGLVAYNIGTIINCYAKGTVESASTNYRSMSGVLVGYNEGIITNCYSAGSAVSQRSLSNFSLLTFGSFAGGLVGWSKKGTIQNSYSSAVANTTNLGNLAYSYGGGLVGYLENATLINCFAVGNVSSCAMSESKSLLGGLIGKSSIGNITNCYRNASQLFARFNSASSNATDNSGEMLQEEQFNSLIFLLKDLGLNTFYDKDTFSVDQTAAWILIENELPSLFFESECDYYAENSAHDYEAQILEDQSVWICKSCGHTCLRIPQYNASIIDIYSHEVICTKHQNADVESDYRYEYKDASGKVYMPISNLNELKGISMSGNYILVNNITSTDSNWTPLGRYVAVGDDITPKCASQEFSGIFDGNGYTISGIKRTNSIEDYYKTVTSGENTTTTAYSHIGLFGYTASSAIIRNLNVDVNFLVTEKGNLTEDKKYNYQNFYVGGIVGYNKGSIKNCDVTGNINLSAGTTPYVGGLVGTNAGNKLIEKCKTSTSIISSDTAGGLIGKNAGASRISSCSASGSVIVDIGAVESGYAGGFIGTCSAAAVIVDCYSSGSVSSEYYGGGFIGSLTANATISASYSTASVAVNTSLYRAVAGGFIGYADSGTITSCYSTGAIISNKSFSIGNNHAGGFIGWMENGTVSTCYSISNIEATGGYDGFGGGLIGRMNAGTVAYCFAIGNINAKTDVGGLMGKKDSGTVSCCYISDSQVIKKNGSTASGYSAGETATAVENFKDVSYLKTNLAFDNYSSAQFSSNKANAWLFSNGQFPYLYGQGNSISISCDPKLGEITAVDYYSNAALQYSSSRQYSGSGIFLAGTEVSVSADIIDGYQLIGWYIDDDLISCDQEFEYTMPSYNLSIFALIAETPLIRESGYYKDYQGVHYELSIEDKSAKIIGYDQEYKAVLLKDYVLYDDEYRITSIAAGAFKDCTELVTVLISKHIEYIGEEAFADCSSLSTIYFQGNAPLIGSNVFRGCKETEDKLTITYNADYIADNNIQVKWQNITGWRSAEKYPTYNGWVKGTGNVDYDVVPYKDLEVLNSASFDSQTVYYSLDSEGSAAVGDSTEGINTSGYDGTNNGSVRIPSSVLKIDPSSGICSVYTVSIISENAFNTNTVLVNLIVGNNISTIGSNAFAECLSLNSIVFCCDKQAISEDALSNTSESLKILRYMENNSWNGFDELFGKKVYTVAALDDNDFDSQGILYTYAQDSTSAAVGNYNDVPDKDELINTSLFAGSSAIIPDYVMLNKKFELKAVKEISRYAFYKNNELTNISIGRMVSVIYDCSFRECFYLNSISVVAGNQFFSIDEQYGVLLGKETLDGCFTKVIKAPADITEFSAPSGILTIDNYAFYGTKLNSLTLTDVTTVGDSAFRCTNIVGELDLSSVTGIGNEAFYGCRVSSIILSGIVHSIGSQAFYDCAELEKFEQPSTENSTFSVEDGLLFKNDTNEGFACCTLIQYPAEKRNNSEYTLSENVNSIGAYAFRGNKYLKNIICANIEDIGVYAFENCNRLQYINIGNIQNIGFDGNACYESSVFKGCNNLSKITVSTENEIYYSDVNGILFNKNQTSLLVYPQGITRVTYTVPSTVKLIKNSAFNGNTHLIRLVLPENVENIEANAFESCTALKSLYIKGGSAPKLESNAFLNSGTKHIDGYENNKTIVFYRKNSTGWTGLWSTQALCEYNIIQEVGNQIINSSLYMFSIIDSAGLAIDANIQVNLYFAEGEDFVLYSQTVLTAAESIKSGPYVIVNLPSDDKIAAGIKIKMCQVNNANVELPNEEKDYFNYVNEAFELDMAMRLSYISLCSVPTVKGISCAGSDINSQTKEINLVNYRETVYERTASGKDIEKLIAIEDITIQVAGYCDIGWEIKNYVLIQDGIEIAKTITSQKNCKFSVSPLDIKPDVPIEARIEAYDKEKGEDSAVYYYGKPKVLNINVINYAITSEDIDISSDDLAVNVGESNILSKLLNANKLNFSFGKKVKTNIEISGSEIIITLGVAKNIQQDKTYHQSVTAAELKEEYDSNHGAHNFNTYFFQIPYGEPFGNDVYNVRFARNTQDNGYLYYRCLNKTTNVIHYGVIQASGRVGCGMKLPQILSHAAQDQLGLETVRKGYCDSIGNSASVETHTNFDASLKGRLVFKYSLSGGIKFVSGSITGEISYVFNTSAQFVVWVIPVTVNVSISLEGKVFIGFGIDYENSNKLQISEAVMTLNAELNFDVGIGCSIASVGVYGTIGTTFVFEFLPEAKIDEWKIYGSLGIYAKIASFKKSKKIWSGEYYIIKCNETAGAYEIVDYTDNSDMFLMSNYSFINSEDGANSNTNQQIVIIDGRIVKFYLDNVKNYGLADYDEYNYLKTVYSTLLYDEESGYYWSEPEILDDNGLSDIEFEVYSNNSTFSVVYSQLKIKLSENEIDDFELYAGNVEVKVAYCADGFNWNETTDNWNINGLYISALTNDDCYQSNLAIAVANDVLTLYWVENSDNNMFGVSPYNYIDANGVSHIFPTQANSLHYIQHVNGSWGSTVCVTQGLSPVTDVLLTSNGYLIYIVDENGDLTDIDDRMMYCLNLESYDGTPLSGMAVFEESGAYSGLKEEDEKLVYYLTKAIVVDDTVQNAMGLYSTNIPVGGSSADISKFIEADTSAVSGTYVLLKNSAENLIAVLYADKEEWRDESGKSVSGSTVYALFRADNGVWGNRCKLIELRGNFYIEEFDAVLLEDTRIIITVLWVCVENDAASEECIYSNYLQTMVYDLHDSIKICDATIDYNTASLDLIIENNGTNYIDLVYISVDDNPWILYNASLASGMSTSLNISLIDNSSYSHTVAVSAYSDGSDAKYINIDMEYTDISINGKQLILDGENCAVVSMFNAGLDTDAVIYVFTGSYPIGSFEGMESDAGKLCENEFSFTILSNQMKYFEIVIDSLMISDENPDGIITIFVKSNKTDINVSDNYCYILINNKKESEADFSAIAVNNARLSINQYIFDKNNSEDFYAELLVNDAVECVSIELGSENLMQSEYFSEIEDNLWKITISKEKLRDFAVGEYTIIINFECDNNNGNKVIIVKNIKLIIVSAPTHNVIFINDDGTQIAEFSEMQNGERPEFDSDVPTKASSEHKIYTFLGWDTDDDGKVDYSAFSSLPKIYSNMIFRAVYKWDYEKFEITFIVGSIQSVEKYYYSDTPIYKGVTERKNQYLLGWDINDDGKADFYKIESLPSVTNNATYIAVFRNYEVNVFLISVIGGSGTGYYEYGTTATLSASVPENQVFIGWQVEENTISTDVLYNYYVENDAVITVVCAPVNNSVNYYVDDTLIYSDDYAYGDAVTVRAIENKEGYTFSGWSDAPNIMPAATVNIFGSFIINSYNMYYYVDGELFCEETYNYGANINAIEDCTRSGHTFSGWTNVPNSMPANNVNVYGLFTANTYRINYYVSNALKYTDLFAYGEDIDVRARELKQGFTFVWQSEIPATMPDTDINIYGEFHINSYLVKYYVDREIMFSDIFDYGSIVAQRGMLFTPGYTFSGWSNIPETMPGNDVIVNGSWSINYYNITFDAACGEGGCTLSLAYKEKINPPTVSRLGYVFNGWSPNVYQTTPAIDVTYTAQWVAISELNNAFIVKVTEVANATNFANKFDLINAAYALFLSADAADIYVISAKEILDEYKEDYNSYVNDANNIIYNANSIGTGLGGGTALGALCAFVFMLLKRLMQN